MDCFTQNWSNCNNGVCPPPSLILSVLKHMQFWKACGVVIVPEWKSAAFWPRICPYLPQFVSFLKGFIIFLEIWTFNQYNEGHKVFIASSSNATCPVAITNRYLNVLPKNLLSSRLYSSEACNILFSRAGDFIRLPDIFGYGTHSLKREAASAAVNSGLVTSQQIDLHAGWKCAESKRCYVEHDLPNRLAVSRSLKL